VVHTCNCSTERLRQEDLEPYKARLFQEIYKRKGESKEGRTIKPKHHMFINSIVTQKGKLTSGSYIPNNKKATIVTTWLLLSLPVGTIFS
jgi:hypothetical protein